VRRNSIAAINQVVIRDATPYTGHPASVSNRSLRYAGLQPVTECLIVAHGKQAAF
jgi:hypothetical protein